MSHLSKSIRDAVILRDGGRCLRCRRPAHDIHHRAARGAGGSKYRDTVPNLVSLCRGCHSWIEAHPNIAREGGWKLSGIDADAPETVPIVDLSGTRWTLDDSIKVRWTQ